MAPHPRAVYRLTPVPGRPQCAENINSKKENGAIGRPPFPGAPPSKGRGRAGHDSVAHSVTSYDSSLEATSLSQLERQEVYAVFAKIVDVHAKPPHDTPYLTGRTFLKELQRNGLLRSDPRLAGVIAALDELGGVGARMTFSDFQHVISHCKVRTGSGAQGPAPWPAGGAYLLAYPRHPARN